MGQAKVRKQNGTYPIIPTIPIAFPEDLVGIKYVAERALIEIKHRSFSGRPPDLGKMVNCTRCGLRHRSTQCHINKEWLEIREAEKLRVIRNQRS